MLTLEQKYMAILILASYAYNMDHFLKCINDNDFLTPKWLEKYYGFPIQNYIRIDLIEIAGYKPEWFE